MITVLLLVLSLIGANDKNEKNVKTPLVLFERVFINPNDPYHVRGEIIDSHGRIHVFNNRNNRPGLKFRNWNLGTPDAQPYAWEMTPAEVETNLNMTDSVVGVISGDTLSRYVHLLSLIAASNQNFDKLLVRYKEAGSKASPQGGTLLYGFIYDAQRNIYKRIWIEEHGDVEWQNQTEYLSEFKQWRWSE